MKCREHYQGDRCVKDAGHDSALALTVDNTHVGQFNAWKVEASEKKLVAVAQGSRIRKYNKTAVKNLDLIIQRSKEVVKGQQDFEVVKMQLTELEKHFRGE